MRCRMILSLAVMAPFAAGAAAPEAATTRAATQPATKTAAALKAEPPAVISLEQARAKYDHAVKIAREQLLRDLNELKRRAMKSENLDEANALAEQIQNLERDQGSGSPLRTRGGKTVNVRANQDWQPTSIVVRKGDVLDVTAKGQWITNDRMPGETTYGPDGLRADGTSEDHGPWSILLARIGPKVYFIGRGARITAEHDGALEFRSNDFSIGDNAGALRVTVVQDGE